MQFSIFELKEIAKAWIAISIAFAIILGSENLFSNQFFINFLISAFTVGLGFLLHELAHKRIAQKYGCIAEFRAFNFMLVLAIAFSFFGFVFAAPGAVFISGHVTKRRNGIISLAGPVMNMILALVFFGISFLALNPLLTKATNYGMQINAWLALFNLIPIFFFDGSKVLAWDKRVYFTFLALAIVLVFFL